MILLYVLAGAVLALVLFDRLLPVQAARAGIALERRRSGLVARQASLPYLEGGSGPEVLVLVHGFAGDKDNFTRMAAFLTPHYRVIIPDLPGFGDARRDASEPHDIPAQVENVRRLMAELGVQHFHLGGNSMGGFISSQYAASHPEQVLSLWLLDPAGTEQAYDIPVFHHYAATGDMPLLVRQPADIQRMIDACMSKPPFFPPCVKKVLGQRAMDDYPLHAHIMRELVAATPLSGITDTPALIVWGTEDRILNPKAAGAMKALLPRSQVVLMEGIGHCPMLEAPRQAARDFLAFQRNLPQLEAQSLREVFR